MKYIKPNMTISKFSIENIVTESATAPSQMTVNEALTGTYSVDNSNILTIND